MGQCVGSTSSQEVYPAAFEFAGTGACEDKSNSFLLNALMNHGEEIGYTLDLVDNDILSGPVCVNPVSKRFWASQETPVQIGAEKVQEEGVTDSV
jgi:hypothetical protein